MSMFAGAGGGASLPPWMMLNRGEPGGGFSPVDQKIADAGKKASGIDIASLLQALQGLQQPAPEPPPAPQFAPMPAPRFLGALRDAPRLAQARTMPAPDWIQPYLWGVR
jgi:hypothetical protein